MRWSDTTICTHSPSINSKRIVGRGGGEDGEVVFQRAAQRLQRARLRHRRSIPTAARVGSCWPPLRGAHVVLPPQIAMPRQMPRRPRGQRLASRSDGAPGGSWGRSRRSCAASASAPPRGRRPAAWWLRRAHGSRVWRPVGPPRSGAAASAAARRATSIRKVSVSPLRQASVKPICSARCAVSGWRSRMMACAASSADTARQQVGPVFRAVQVAHVLVVRIEDDRLARPHRVGGTRQKAATGAGVASQRRHGELMRAVDQLQRQIVHGVDVGPRLVGRRAIPQTGRLDHVEMNAVGPEVARRPSAPAPAPAAAWPTAARRAAVRTARWTWHRCKTRSADSRPHRPPRRRCPARWACQRATSRTAARAAPLALPSQRPAPPVV